MRFYKLGRGPEPKICINVSLHMADNLYMADALKNIGKGNLLVFFAELDIDVLDSDDGRIRAKINGVDSFHPNTDEIRSDGSRVSQTLEIGWLGESTFQGARNDTGAYTVSVANLPLPATLRDYRNPSLSAAIEWNGTCATREVVDATKVTASLCGQPSAGIRDCMIFTIASQSAHEPGLLSLVARREIVRFICENHR